MPKTTPPVVLRTTILLALLSIATPAFPVVLPEVPVGDPVLGPAPGDHCCMSIASDGSEFFAVWMDGRKGVYGYTTRGTRVSRGGAILDPLGIPLPLDGMRDLQLVWGGTSYLVFASTNAPPYKVMALRLDRQGRVIDGPRAVADGSTAGTRSVAVNGSRILVVYSTQGQNARLRTLVLDESLRTLRDVELIPDAQIAVAAYRDGFVATWVTLERVLYVARLSDDGSVVGWTSRHTAFTDLAIATDGTDILVLARELTPSMHFRTTTVLVAGDLTSIGSSVPLPDSGYRYPSDLFWTGDHYVAVVNDDSNRVLFSRFERDGSFSSNVEGPPGRISRLRAGASGSDFLLTWTSFDPGESGTPLMSQVFSSATQAAKEPARPLTLSAPRQQEPEIAFGASMYAVVWQEKEGLFATRLTADGRSLDGRGVPVGESLDERVLFDGSQFVVPFLRKTHTFAGPLVVRFLSPENGMLPGELALAGDVLPGNFAVAAGRDGVLVVWSGNDGRVRAVTIDRATRMLTAPPVAISPSTIRGVFPSAAWNGAEYLVTFTESVAMFWHGWYEQAKAIRAVRLSGDLLVRDAEPLTISTGWEQHSSVESNGHDWLVAWDRHMRRVLHDGSMTAATELLSVFEELVWDGANYVAMWSGPLGDVSLVYIPPQGPIVLSEPVIVERGTRAISSAAPRSIAFAYTRIAQDERYAGVERVFMRVLANVPPRRRAAR